LTTSVTSKSSLSGIASEKSLGRVSSVFQGFAISLQPLPPSGPWLRNIKGFPRDAGDGKNFSGAAGDEKIAIWAITNNKLPDVAKLKAKEKKRMLMRRVFKVKVPKKKKKKKKKKKHRLPVLKW
jgi:hypothetical protein